ncbi:RUSD3 synthase, partial [Nothoprocta ornata]|nr:RUSD3 synthase [Nothoprocta ornata]
HPRARSAVTVGVPAEPQGEVCTGLRREQRGATVAVVPVTAPSRRSLARKEVKRTVTRYRVLGAAGGCALLQLQPRTGGSGPAGTGGDQGTGSALTPPAGPAAFPGQLLAHLTLLLCPALGDHEHSVPVGRVLGQPFLLPAEAARPPEQVGSEHGVTVTLRVALTAPGLTLLPPQVLDEELERRLRLEPGPRRRRLPLHVHLEQLALP